MSSEAIYNRIAMLRAERGISRRELADALGVHYQTVGYLERGEVIFSHRAVPPARHSREAGHCQPPCQAACRHHMCEAVDIAVPGVGLHD
jgi:uncharacterized protein YcbK (DUF882 family)